MVLILLCSFSLAAPWLKEANAGFYESEYKFLGFAYNFPQNPAYVNASTYSVCSISAATFSPLIADVNYDQQNEVITASASSVYVYNSNCDLIQIITPGGTITGTPGITNFNSNEYLELEIPTSTGVSAWEFDGTTFNQDFSITLPQADVSVISCDIPKYFNLCLIRAGTETYLLDAAARTATLTANVSTATRTPVTWDDYYGLSNVLYGSGDSISGYDILYPDCNYGESGKLDIVEWNNTGGIKRVLQISHTQVNPVTNQNSECFMAKLGSSYYLFISLYVQDASKTSGSYLLDPIGGTILYNETTTSATASYSSNWAVGDYDKDGYNEGCYLRQYISGQVNFTCVDKNLQKIVNENVTGIITFDHFVLADFVPEFSTLGIGMADGVWYINGTNISRVISSGITRSAAHNGGYPIVASTGTTDIMMAFADSTGGYILSNNNLALYCGDMICSYFENLFNCPGDCNVTISTTGGDRITGQSCRNADGTVNASLCRSGKCNYGFCALKNVNEPCSADWFCLSGTCDNGFCTAPGIWAQTNAAKTEMFGNDANSNNFISLVLILVPGLIIAGAGLMGGFALVGVGIGFAWIVLMTFFFTLVLWLSPFFLIGLVLVGLFLFALKSILAQGG